MMISLFLANAWGWCRAHWKILAAIAGVLALVLIVNSFCNKKRSQVKIDEPALQKINSDNERERKAQLEKIVLENQKTIKTVDERTELAEINTVERDAAIDEKIKVVDRKIQDAKAQGKDVTSAELECMLTGKCE